MPAQALKSTSSAFFKAFAHRGVFSELFFELIVKNDNERVDAIFELI